MRNLPKCADPSSGGPKPTFPGEAGLDLFAHACSSDLISRSRRGSSLARPAAEGSRRTRTARGREPASGHGSSPSPRHICIFSLGGFPLLPGEPRSAPAPDTGDWHWGLLARGTTWEPGDIFDILKSGGKRRKRLQGPCRSWERVKPAECVHAGASCLRADRRTVLHFPGPPRPSLKHSPQCRSLLKGKGPASAWTNGAWHPARCCRAVEGGGQVGARAPAERPPPLGST